jgi:hypothetical protein
VAVTATYDNTLSRVQVSVTSVPAAADTVYIERSTDQTNWTLVRGASALVPSGSAVAIDDYEFVDGVTNYYRASYVDNAAPSFVAAGGAATDANASGTNPIVPGNAAHIQGDLLLCYATCRTPTAQAVAPSGWSILVDNGGQALLGRRTPSNATPAPSVTFTGAGANGTLIAFPATLRNCELQPAVQAKLTNASAQNVAYPALDPGADSRIVVAAGQKSAVSTSWSTIPSMTELQEASSALGLGGSAAWDYWVQTTRTLLAAGSFTVAGGAAAVSKGLAAAFTKAAFIYQETGSVTPQLDSVWLKSISEPFLNRPVDVILTASQSATRDARDGVFEITGRSFPVAVTDLRGSKAWTMQIRTYTVADADEMDTILSAGDPMYIHVPAGCQVLDGHVRIGQVTQTWDVLRPGECTFTLPCRAVAAPAASIIPAVGTWQTVLSAYPTWADVLAAQATWADLLELAGSPGDVVVL